jgi:L-ribulose-5-phosphate 4-epimerase
MKRGPRRSKEGAVRTTKGTGSDGDLRAELAHVAKELYTRGLMTFTGGNLSARDPRQPGRVWITPAGEFKGGLCPGSMIAIDLDGTSLSRAKGRPSSDYQFHCAIYRRRPDVNAIVHTHAQQATGLALTGTPFLPITADAAAVGDIPVVPHLAHGSAEQAEAVASGIGAGHAVLMQNHGLIVAAEDLQRAAAMTEAIEATAGTLLTCRMMGVRPAVIPMDEVRRMRTDRTHGG